MTTLPPDLTNEHLATLEIAVQATPSPRYWLAPEYHGQGIMAKALNLMLQEISIKEVGKRKYNSTAFVGNWASRKTMEKAGFVVQPELKISKKDGVDREMWRLRLYLTDEHLATREVAVEATPSPK
ncbi:hypothetical protein BGZ83_007865 [Gryganskiella cystojenkinii]|nr:hypothetical protein BGZ83_007865 [Gryganskiella cystojenkinii]